MLKVNAFNCLTGTSNTGINDCNFEIAEIYGAILIPKNKAFTKQEIQDFKTTLTGLAQNADQKLRIYPIGRFMDFEDQRTEPTTSTSNYGFDTITRDGAYRWTFSYNNGHCFHQGLMSFRGQHNRFNVLFVDRKGAIIGVKTSDGGMRGFTLSQLYVNNAPLPNGNDPVWYTITFALSDPAEFNTRLAFVYDESFSPLTEIAGLIDVELEAGALTATTAVVGATMNCGGVDLADLFASELADPTVWVVKNAATGATLAPDTVAATSDGFLLTFTGSTGLTLTIALAAPSVLEGEGVVSPNGSLVESNTIRITMP